MANPDRTNAPYIRDSEQSVLNKSQDVKYDVLAVELLTENDAGTALDRVKSGVLGKPTSGYGINNITADATYKYFGFESPAGAWYIMRKTLADGTFQYAAGSSNYATAWTSKSSQAYANYGDTF